MQVEELMLDETRRGFSQDGSGGDLVSERE